VGIGGGTESPKEQAEGDFQAERYTGAGTGVEATLAREGIFWRLGSVLWLYRILFPLALVVVVPTYLRRTLRRGGLREKFGQRFGAHPRLKRTGRGGPRIWLQAVSVGEMLAERAVDRGAASGRCGDLSDDYDQHGLPDRAGSLPKYVVGVGYFPGQTGRRSRCGAWRAIRPDLVILTEGERWPEHLRQAQNRGVPVIAINARLSDR